MSHIPRVLFLIHASAAIACAAVAHAAAAPYSVINKVKVGGAGGFDYVTTDSEAHRVYVPRGNRVMVYDSESLKEVGQIADAPSVHGAVIDPVSHHGFSSSKPVVMWDSRTLAVIKTIPVEGSPDGIMLDPATQRVFVLSHRAPNATIIDAKDGSLVGTLDLGGAPEQGASDGAGRVYIDIEDKDNVAVVDSKNLIVLAHYDLSTSGKTPAGLALDQKNSVLFAFCRNPAVCVILSAKDGKILQSLPIGVGTDGGAFNPSTSEAFSSQRDGTLTVIREKTPSSFEVAQTVSTMVGAKTCALDAATGKLYLIAAEMVPPPVTPTPAGIAVADDKGARPARAQMVPDSFSILVVGK